MALQFVDNLVVQTGDLLHLFLLGQRSAHEVIRMDVLRDFADVPASELLLIRSYFFAGYRGTPIFWDVVLVYPCDESKFVI